MFRSTLIVLMSCFVTIANAAEPLPQGETRGSPTITAMPLTGDELVELDEVFVEGRRPVTDTRQLIAWIDRLVGQFSYEGSVERHNVDGSIDRAVVDGGSQCVRLGKSVAVQCQLNVIWGGVPGSTGQVPPGGASPLAPAVVVYGLSHSQKYFGHLQVDSYGIATGGRGWLVDDTLISREPCADFPDCQRVVRLEAPPDAKVIRMRVDLERKGTLQVRHDFQWNRQTELQAAGTYATAAVTPAGSPARSGVNGSINVPPSIEAWLRRLPGKFSLGVYDENACWAVETSRAMVRPLGGAWPEPRNCRRSSDERAAMNNRPPDVECQGIGAGPGVRCVMYMAWPESGIPVSRPPHQTLNSSYLMYGYDPLGGGIALVLVVPVAVNGPAGFSAGLLEGDTLTYISDCGRPPCTTTEQMSIAPGAEGVLWQRRTPGLRRSGTGNLVEEPTFRWGMARLREPGPQDEMETAPRPGRSRSSPGRP